MLYVLSGTADILLIVLEFQEAAVGCICDVKVVGGGVLVDQTKGCYVVSEPAETLGEVSERLHYLICNPKGCALHYRH